ncbi:MAG: hypothetical protein LBF41_04715, partial [Deltaproteobacteria bacterium]|nr:hypothetical protein [Deltaproteobacteria bacterium]
MLHGDVAPTGPSGFVAVTRDVEGKNYSEAYFDIPVSFTKPYYIGLRIDYSTTDQNQYAELVFPDYSYIYVPSTDEQMINYKDKSLVDRYWKGWGINQGAPTLQHSNLIYAFGPESDFPETNFYFNHINTVNEGYYGLNKKM